METTFEPSLLQNFQSRITVIEAIELTFLTLGVWCLGAYNDIRTGGADLAELISFLVIFEIIVLGSWAIYNLYIRIARAAGQSLDIAIWVLSSIATASYTFWAWTILDINRFIVSRLLYRGEAPVEFAWSSRSKQVRKLWEQARKAGSL
jgi:hypothetical protein